MKKSYIITIVLIVIIVVAFFVFKNKKLEAPEINTYENTSVDDQVKIPTPESSQTSAPLETTKPTISANTGAVKEFTVSGQNFSFTPSMIKVKKGDKVKITFNNTQGFHDFKIDEFGVATAQEKSPATEVLEFTADKVGQFEYYCSVGSHRSMGMKGTLVVE